MTGDFTNPAGVHVPPVAGPDFLRMKPLGQLANDGLDPAPLLRQRDRPGRRLMGLHLKWSQQLDPFFAQALEKPGAPVIPVGEAHAFGPLKHMWGHANITRVCRGELRPHDHSWPSDAHMAPQAVKRLASQFVIAESSDASQSFASPSPSKPADRDWKAVNNRKLPVGTRHALQKGLKPFFDLPEVRGLPGKGRSVNLAHRRKQVQGKNSLRW